MTGVLKTAQVECDTNKYSVPASCAGQIAQLCIYPYRVEVWMSGRKVATHKRCFERRKSIHNPLHEHKALDLTPAYKMRRIYQVVTQMDPALLQFINAHEEVPEREAAACEIFHLLRTHSRAMVLSAVRELNAMGTYKIMALRSRLNLPAAREPQAVWPKDTNLLNIKYQERTLDEYNPNS